MSDARLRLETAAVEAAAATASLPADDRADAVERAMAVELGRQAAKSMLYVAGEIDPARTDVLVPPEEGDYFLMGQDPRLAPMPDRPTLVDFFRLRLPPGQQHLLQSAALARAAGCDDKVILACLLHDISGIAFIRPDHGYWAAQMIEPYVDEEVAWAVRHHQALRFFADEEAGYAYPAMYVTLFSADYTPPPYVREAYERARRHRWYPTARLITINDVYAFDPDRIVVLDEFVEIIERNFRQPAEGLGYDDSPSAHMWRTMIAPTRAL